MDAQDWNLVVSVILLAFVAYREYITKTTIRGLKDQFEMARNINNMINIESIKSAHEYQVKKITENFNGDMIALQKAYQELNDRY